MLRSKARVKKHLHLVPSPYLLLQPLFNPVMLNLVSETLIQFKDGKFIVFRSKSRKFGVITFLPLWVIIHPRHQIGASCCWLFTHTWGYSPACLTPSLSPLPSRWTPWDNLGSHSFIRPLSSPALCRFATFYDFYERVSGSYTLVTHER